MFKKYKEYQRKVMKVETEIIRLQNQLEALDKYKEKRDEVNKERDEILKQKIEQLKKLVDNTVNNNQYTSIRNFFSEIAKKITNDTAYISLRLNSSNNIEFDCRYDESAKSEGNTYYKLLCISFDIALSSYRQSNSILLLLFNRKEI